MPTVNIYHKDGMSELESFVPKLKGVVAEKLSFNDKEISPDEISVRLVSVEESGMIGNVELEITAHAYKERIEKQDEICNAVRDYAMREAPALGDVRVWLKLSELGHSW